MERIKYKKENPISLDFIEWEKTLIATDNKRVVIIIGPSGSGKTTLGRELEKMLGFKEVVSTTTRPVRENDGEIDGVNYHFVSDEEFDKRLRNNEFVETSEYGGERYGVEYQSLLSNDNSPRYIVLNVDGANQMIAQSNKKDQDISFLVFWLNIKSYQRMFKRLYNRGDRFTKILGRMKHAYDNDELKNPQRKLPSLSNAEFQELDSSKSLTKSLSMIYYLLLEHSANDRYNTVTELEKVYTKLKEKREC